MPERPPVPESISGCAIEGTLREGPAVLVVRARDSLGLPLELHLFQADLLSARVPKTVFFDQVRATAGLHHERLASVVNAGEKGAWWFVACKGTEGATLASLFARGHLDEERALGIFAGVAEGLAGLEAAGLRHGALDPTAVGLPGAGQVRLSLRRLVPVDLAARDPRYLSPEEARGEDGGMASDLYVLGLLIGEALFGRPLLEGGAEEIRIRVARGEVPAPSAILRGVLPQTVDLVTSLLSAAPRGRPASAADTVRILRSLQGAFGATESLEGSFAAPLAAVPVAGAAPTARPAGAPPLAIPVAPQRGQPPVVPPTAPPVAPSAAAAAMAPAARTRRAHARLILPHRGVEQVHELLEAVTWIGPADGGRIVARGSEFAGAVARLEVGAQVDSLVATGADPRPRIRGQELTRVDLAFGDSFEVGAEVVTFEKAGRLLLEGEEGAEEGRSHRIREKPSRMPIVAGVVLALGALAWGGLRWSGASGARAEELAKARARGTAAAKTLSDLPPPPSATSASEKATREETALRLLDRAREERALNKNTQARDKIDNLLRLYPDTAASLLAAEDMRELRILLKENGQEEFRDVQAQSESLAAAGKNAEAFDLLRSFADSHGGTLAGDRATLAAEAVARIASDRVDDLLRAARAAAERKDWTAALDAVKRADAVATGESRRRIADEKERLLQSVPRGTPSEGGATGGTPEKGRKGTAVGPGTEKPPGPSKPPAKATTKDDEATELFRSSREAVEAGKFGQGERGFYRLLTEFTDTRVVRDYATEVWQRYDEAGRKGHFAAGLFRGDALFKGGRITLSYDFTDPAEAADFETVHPFQVPNKGTFKVERGELVAEGAAAFMLRAGFKPDSVTMNFRIRPGIPPQDMGAMMAETKDPLNHVLFTVANEYFKLGKGDKAYAIPGNVIFVFGKGMWKSTDAGMVGFVKTAASEDPKVEANKWTAMEVGKDKDKARWTFDGKTLNGRAVGDNKYELTGIRPALFVLLSEAHFDEVSIEGELDPEWVKAERERVFPAPK